MPAGPLTPIQVRIWYARSEIWDLKTGLANGSLFCFFIVGAYIPQYMSIIRHGTRGIASRYILFHCLFSICTLGLRVSHYDFYKAYNCVRKGAYKGWWGLSALLGFIQAIVQWLAAMVLLAMYIHYRDDGIDDNNNELPTQTMQIIVGVVAGVALSISFAFIGCNNFELFTNDDLYLNGYWMAAYIFGLGVWMSILQAPNAVFLFLPVVYQIKMTAALGGDHGSLSFLSLGLQAGMFMVLGALQAARNWSNIKSAWSYIGHVRRFGHFVETFLAFYGTISTHVAYVMTSVGCLVILVYSVIEQN
ncbi:hypothetical protein SEUCBS139899_004125 [Sporothrix eucalyptigena]